MTVQRAVTSWLKADKLTSDFKLTSKRIGVAEPAIGRYSANAKLIHLIRHSLPSVVVCEPLDKRLDTEGRDRWIVLPCSVRYNLTNSQQIRG